MSISGITGLSGAVYPLPERSSVASQASVESQASGQPQPAASASMPPAAVTGASGSGELLSPSVLAALLGQNLQLFGSSFGA